MEPRQNNLSQFKYEAMSNLVLQADRRFVTRRGDENTGDPESLAGRINIRDMGSRGLDDDAQKKHKEAKSKLNVQRGNITEGGDVLEREQRKRKRGEGAGAPAVAQADLEVDDLRYKPRTPATRQTFGLITTIVGKNLGDVPLRYTQSATDAVLEYLKDEDLKDFDKKKEIDDLLGSSMTSKEFNELVNLGKKITDYDAQEGTPEAEPDIETAGRNAEEDQQGVAVVFDDTDDEDGDAPHTFEVRDESESEDDEEPPEMMDADAAEAGDVGGTDVGEDMLIQGDVGVASKPEEEDEQVVAAHDIDAFWLQREIGYIYTDPHDQQLKTAEALKIMSAESDDGQLKPLREVENDLMDLFEYEHNALIAKLVVNRDKIVWVTRWRQVADNKGRKAAVEQEMVAAGHRQILDDLLARETGAAAAADKSQAPKKMKMDLTNLQLPESKDVDMTDAPKVEGVVGGLQPKRLINLDNLIFDRGNHLMSNPNVKLPQGSTRRVMKGYEEIHVPPPKARHATNEPLKPTSSLPRWAQDGFGSSKNLNRIQTKCFPAAFEDDGNMLVCAPTGSGKTNVAMLAMLREIGKHRNEVTGEINLDDFKIIYIAPLKALVQEQVGNFGARLAPYGIKVAELTGDRQLTKQQIQETQVIVTTPEKYDVITRKATDLSYINLVRLICIDEIHLLHDDRGPVLESIVSRTIRRTEQTGEQVRLLGLSATLPNYRDVASFLRVDQQKNMFHFDGTYRPCPLKQEFIGVTDKKAIKQLKTMNDVCYAKVLEHVGKNRNQMLIFVHSRKETVKTATYIKDKALDNDTIGQILQTSSAVQQILKEEAADVKNADLANLLPYGFGVHHAGMTREDRSLVEDLFSDGSIQVLVCTATLAWGVNLPAHSVIIKGTQVYSPEKGSWVELSPQDVLQMLGRAGRPQFDTYGEGIIITTQAEMQYYLSLLNQQLPIESQLVSRLVDNLNAEVVLGNVRTRDEGVDWLGYTYLFVRMLRSPGLYSVGAEYEDDAVLEQKRVDLIHSAATVLEKSNLVKYEKKTGKLQPTELGRIASHYYITHSSMATYNQHLQPNITPIELFRIFALSEEFKYIPVRQDEKLELAKLLQNVPIPIKEGIEEPQAKINALLQAFISRLKLDGLALMADLVYVTQSAGRILRAIFEICLKKGWAEVAKIALDLCKMAEKRMWPTMSPLRQFPSCPKEVIQKAERVDVPFSAYFDLEPQAMGQLLNMPKVGKFIAQLVEKFPRLEVEAQVVPITRSTLRMDLQITPNFVWDDTLHGNAESFWILVEDCDGEEVLFHDQFILRKDFAQSEEAAHTVSFTVPIAEPMPPHYFVTIVSDRWMHSETKIAVSFRTLVLPAKFPPHTQILDLQPLPVGALKRKEYQALYKDIDRFNKVQTQVFTTLYETDDDAFVGAATGMGKTFCAEFAILRHWSQQDRLSARIVYLAPFQELVNNQYKAWEKRLAGLAGGKTIVKLTGETNADIRLLEQGDLILATPSQWDVLSRAWQRRESIQTLGLLIADDLHMLGAADGHVYETVISRMRAMTGQIEDAKLRFVGLSVSLSNGRDVGEWLGATKLTTFNFSPHVRAVPLELHIQSYTIPHFPSLMLAMVKPTYQAITQMSPDKPAMVFVPSRKQVRLTANDLIAAAGMEGNEDRFLNVSLEEIAPILEEINEFSLRDALSHGIGYYHEALNDFDKKAVRHLYHVGAVQVMVVSRDACWEIDSFAHLVVVMNTQFYDGREHRYIDYPIHDILQMFGKAGRVGQDKIARGVLMVPAVRREYYKKFLNEALPIESQLGDYLADAFVSEISSQTIESTQEALDWSTYTYFYRRLLANPSFYGLNDTSHEGLSAHLSETVEGTLKELADAQIIEIDEEDDSIAPLNACLIAAHYNISFITMQTLLLSLGPKSSISNILEIVSAATEFENIQIRRHEAHILRRIYDRVQYHLKDPNFESPTLKAFVLLQAHFSRIALPVDLAKDQEVVLKKVLNLLSAAVDVLSSEAHLNAIHAMELSQMVVQAMWPSDSPLKQIPHFDNDTVKVARKYGIEDIDDFMNAMDPEENQNYNALLKDLAFDNKKLADAAKFTNNYYPNVEMEFEVAEPESITAGQPAYLNVKITRELDEDEEPNLDVHAQFYPANKTEAWWLVVGDESTKKLLAVKRVTVRRDLKTKLEFTMPQAGKRNLTLFLCCDSYLGVDQAPKFEVEAAEGEESSDEEESGDAMEE